VTGGVLRPDQKKIDKCIVMHCPFLSYHLFPIFGCAGGGRVVAAGMEEKDGERGVCFPSLATRARSPRSRGRRAFQSWPTSMQMEYMICGRELAT
jgi:hypothetical protein